MIRIFQSKILTGILIVIVAWLGIGVWNVHHQKEETDQQVLNIRTKIENLEKENSTIKKILGYLKNPEYLAREARLRLNYKQPDESVAYIYPEEKKASPTPVVKKPESQSVLEKIKDWWYHLIR
jgi:cell division protein FtsB